MGGETHRYHHHHHHHHHHHQFYHKNLHNIHHRSTFLPMLCSRPSIKDVSLPRWRDPPLSSSNDPLSPRIGCMGQVKRNNKIAGFPTSHRLSFTSKSSTTSSASSSPLVKYSKLKNLFTGKNLSTATTTITNTATTISSCGTRQRVAVNSEGVSKKERCSGNSENHGCSISIDDMDPPLPVIKRVQKKVEEGSQVDSLWKRRSGGPALKSLQLQQIHHPRICLQPTSV